MSREETKRGPGPSREMKTWKERVKKNGKRKREKRVGDRGKERAGARERESVIDKVGNRRL